MTVHGKTAIETSNDHQVLDPLTANWKQRECRRDRTREPSERERTLRSSHASPAETLEAREDHKREQASEDSLNSSPRRACSDERGEPTEDGAEQAAGVCRNKRLLVPLLPKEPRKQKSRRAPDERPVVPPPLSLDQVEQEDRKPYGRQHKGHPEAPPSRREGGRRRESLKMRDFRRSPRTSRGI